MDAVQCRLPDSPGLDRLHAHLPGWAAARVLRGGSEIAFRVGSQVDPAWMLFRFLGPGDHLTAWVSRDLKELAPSGCYKFPIGRLSYYYASSHLWIS